MMINFLKYLTLISFIAPFSQESIAKTEDVVMGSKNVLGENERESYLNLDKNEIRPPYPQEFVDADGNLIDPTPEDNSLQALNDAKHSPVANMDVKDSNNSVSDEMPASPAQDEASSPLILDETPFPPAAENVPSSEVDGTMVPVPAEVEEPLLPEIDDVPSLPEVDDIPTPLPLPLPPEDEAPLPPTLESVPSSSEMDEATTPLMVSPPIENEAPLSPSLETENTPLAPAIDESPLLSPSEAAELAATIEDEMRPSPSEVVQPDLAADVSPETSAVGRGTTTRTADNEIENAVGSSMTPPADVSQLSKEQDADERARLQAQQQEDNQVDAQNNFQAKALQGAQQRQLDQHLAKQEAIDLRERERNIHKKTSSKAGAQASLNKLNLKQEQMNQNVKKESVDGSKNQNSSIPQEEQPSSAALTDEHGNVILKDEFISGE